MPVEVGEEAVDVAGSGRVAVPFLCVVTEEGLVREIFRLGTDFLEMRDEVGRKVLVEIGTHEVGAAYGKER